jgi:ATP-dependent Lon protease
MAERLKLPVLPMRETVVFPGVALPISAGRPGTLEAIEQVLDGDRRLFAVCQRENADEAAPEVLYEMGVIVRIVQVQRTSGGLQLLIQGERRAKSLAYSRVGEGMIEADVWVIDPQEPTTPYEPALIALDRELRERAVELGRRRGMPREALAQIVQGVEEPGAFSDLVAFYLDLPAQEKQQLLELFPVAERMRRVLVGVERDLLRLEAQQEIQQKVQEELGEKQREMVLREQLKAIQKELGEDEEGSDIEELEERIAEIELPSDARSEINRELARLRRTNPQSAEYQVIRTYLELVAELPWNERTEDKIDLPEAERVLEEDHYGLEDVKDRILEFLAVRKLQMERAATEAVEDEEAQAAAGASGNGGATPTGTTGNGDEPAEGAAEEDHHTTEVRAKARAVDKRRASATGLATGLRAQAKLARSARNER